MRIDNLRKHYEESGYEFDDGLIVAFERAATGSNAHHFGTMLSAYRYPVRWPVTNSPEKHKLWAVRMRKLLNGMTDDEAYKWWKPEFDKLGPKE